MFAPKPKKFIKGIALSLKCILLMDNVTTHPPVKFILPNTTPILQSMDGQIISNFKKLYTTSPSHKWQCINLINKVWNGISNQTLKTAWQKFCPSCISDKSLTETAAVCDISFTWQEYWLGNQWWWWWWYAGAIRWTLSNLLICRTRK